MNQSEIRAECRYARKKYSGEKSSEKTADSHASNIRQQEVIDEEET
jgi:hypothetical protein